jgi:hypothetical protein
MTSIRIDEDLWRGFMTQQAVLVRWAVDDHALVAEGQNVAELSVEDRRHAILSPCAGRLIHEAEPDDVLAPGDSIGRIEPN